jgi:hypothetical protein
VNIAAVMVALDVDDLDHAAKHALVVVCCRANHRSGDAIVSASRVATDMQVSYKTALDALRRVVEAGYLIVDKSPGRTPRYNVTPVVATGVTPVISDRDPCNQRPNPCNHDRTKDKKEKVKEANAARHGSAAAASAGEKPAAAMFMPGSGWIADWSSNGRIDD